MAALPSEKGTLLPHLATKMVLQVLCSRQYLQSFDRFGAGFVPGSLL